jgi:hypothetical protein
MAISFASDPLNTSIQGELPMTTAAGATCPCEKLLDPKGLGRFIIPGIAGLVVWEVFARLVAPLWIGFALDPTALIEKAFGISGVPAQFLHLLAALVIFPVGYVLVVKPVQERLVPRLPWPLAGLGYGVGLWVFAMYGMASLLGGAPPFLGFEPIAWASLVGHLGLGIGIAGADAALRRCAA